MYRSLGKKFIDPEGDDTSQVNREIVELIRQGHLAVRAENIPTMQRFLTQIRDETRMRRREILRYIRSHQPGPDNGA